MQRLLVLFLLFLSFNTYADQPAWDISPTLGTLLNIKSFDETFTIDLQSLQDLISKDEKIKICMDDYIDKQSKTYTKVVKQNLYDLMNNVSSITSRIQGKKPLENGKTYTEKIEVLAKIQCELYYAINTLK